MKTKILLPLFIFCLSIGVFAQGSYKKPPKEVLDVLNAPPMPSTSGAIRSRCSRRSGNPPIAHLAQPMLWLADERVNPKNNGPHRQPYVLSLIFKNISDAKAP